MADSDKQNYTHMLAKLNNRPNNEFYSSQTSTVESPIFYCIPVLRVPAWRSGNALDSINVVYSLYSTTGQVSARMGDRIGVNPRRLKAPKGDELPRNRL